MARGGYRKPSNPAPVSGPGALSRRTDGGPGSKQKIQEIRTGQYGESKALMEQQQGAPMAGNPMPNPKMPATKVTPLLAPTQRPNEPVTTGMPFGPGANSVSQMAPRNNTTVVGKYLPVLEQLATQPDAPDSFRVFVRSVAANMKLNGLQ